MTRHALVVGAFAASLLAVLLVPLCSRDRVADVEPWVAAVRGERGAIVVHPPWRDDVARAMRAAGHHATVAFAPRHGDAVPPIVVVTDGSAPLPDALAARIEAHEARGALTLLRVRASGGGAGGGRSLLDGLRDARVELRTDDDVIACPWDPVAERHMCTGQPEWQHVAMTELPVGGRKVKCAWVHPKTDATLSVRWQHARVDGGALDLSLALSDGAADNTSGAPVTAALFIDGVEAASVTKRAGQRGFTKNSAKLSAGAGEHDVEVRVTTPNDGQRHACILLETRGAP